MCLTTGMRFMSSNNFFGRAMRSAVIVALLVSSLSPLRVAQADARLFRCPALIQVDGSQLILAGLNVFEGPIEDRVALAPETSPSDPGPMLWHLDSKSTLYMKCRYHESRHFFVLEAKGATQCVATVSDTGAFEASCK
jgi:hypothetical protein